MFYNLSRNNKQNSKLQVMAYRFLYTPTDLSHRDRSKFSKFCKITWKNVRPQNGYFGGVLSFFIKRVPFEGPKWPLIHFRICHCFCLVKMLHLSTNMTIFWLWFFDRKSGKINKNSQRCLVFLENTKTRQNSVC